MARRERWGAEEDAFLREHFPLDDAASLARRLSARTGRERTAQAVSLRAARLGLAKSPWRPPRRAERRIDWGREPEMQAWMEAADEGQSRADLSREFAGRFGFPLSGPQVSQWRQANGRTDGCGHNGRPPRVVPVGARRDTGRGYVLVKVRERPRVPGSKDNWAMEHHLAWERANGRPVPEGFEVVRADPSSDSLDPAGLVLVEKSLVGVMNAPGSPRWHDRDELEACVALARLKRAECAAEARNPRRCGVCGREFAPGPRRGSSPRQRAASTCPDCLAAGRKSRGSRRASEGPDEGRCAVCGRPFPRETKAQRRCRDCIAERPKWSPEAHARSVARAAGGAS